MTRSRSKRSSRRSPKATTSPAAAAATRTPLELLGFVVHNGVPFHPELTVSEALLTGDLQLVAAVQDFHAQQRAA